MNARFKAKLLLSNEGQVKYCGSLSDLSLLFPDADLSPLVPRVTQRTISRLLSASSVTGISGFTPPPRSQPFIVVRLCHHFGREGTEQIGKDFSRFKYAFLTCFGREEGQGERRDRSDF